jgi:hypothetical protein
MVKNYKLFFRSLPQTPSERGGLKNRLALVCYLSLKYLIKKAKMFKIFSSTKSPLWGDLEGLSLLLLGRFRGTFIVSPV